MEGLLIAFAPLLIALAIYATLSIIGVVIEHRHESDLTRREGANAGFLVLDLSGPPPGIAPSAAELVSGNAVLGTGYLKQFLASFRVLVGGEVKSYQRVLTRARREAQLRMIESARARGASAIINVRFDTSDVGGRRPFSEVFCYGTAIR